MSYDDDEYEDIDDTYPEPGAPMGPVGDAETLLRRVIDIIADAPTMPLSSSLVAESYPHPWYPAHGPRSSCTLAISSPSARSCGREEPSSLMQISSKNPSAKRPPRSIPSKRRASLAK